jgi:MtN3 and saliva related transmembrane protein
MNTVLLGLIAGAFTTFAGLPQILHVLRTRKMDDVSLVTLCMFAVGVGLWIVYGMYIASTPVIVWNVLSLAMWLTQIALKVATSPGGVRALERLRQVNAMPAPSADRRLHEIRPAPAPEADRGSRRSLR